KLRNGARFDLRGFFTFCDGLVTHGGMDRKWFPDFVRIVDEFEYTQTEKILVRNLKKAHFHPDRVGSDALYWRQRSDTAFQPFGREQFAALRQDFARAEKVDLLER